MRVEKSGFVGDPEEALGLVAEGMVDVLNHVLSGDMGEVLGMALVVVHVPDGEVAVGKVLHVAGDPGPLVGALRQVAGEVEGAVALARAGGRVQ